MNFLPQPEEGNQKGTDDDEIPDIDDSNLPDCDKFVTLYLIGEMLDESVPIKTITTKSKSDWLPKGEVKFVDMV